MPPRIVLLHATPIAMQPVQTAFKDNWPEAETVNLLDDALTIDRARETDLSQATIDRFVAFGEYGRRIGAAGLLVTCSAFGPAIDRLAETLDIPVLKPNEAMFQAAIDQGAKTGSRIGMLATFGPSVPTMTDEFEEYVSRAGAHATLETIVVDDAIDLLRAGDADSHNRLVAARAPELAHCDAIMLAHFSTSRAANAVRAAVGVPVLTAPHAAVTRMRERVASTRMHETVA
jgi:Asp/Glu/hydantoin racemase